MIRGSYPKKPKCLESFESETRIRSITKVKSRSLFEYNRSSFPLRAKTFYRVHNLPKNEILSEMKSSLELVFIFKLLEGVVGFENIHSSFPDQKRSPEYSIFSEMKSSLILVIVFELFKGVAGFENIHSSFPD